MREVFTSLWRSAIVWACLRGIYQWSALLALVCFVDSCVRIVIHDHVGVGCSVKLAVFEAGLVGLDALVLLVLEELDGFPLLLELGELRDGHRALMQVGFFTLRMVFGEESPVTNSMATESCT